jgi:hypothetical protein
MPQLCEKHSNQTHPSSPKPEFAPLSGREFLCQGKELYS